MRGRNEGPTAAFMKSIVKKKAGRPRRSNR